MTNSPKRILIVDDEAPMRFLLSKQLERAGFDVATAADGAAALATAVECAYDAIVLDLVMPGMDGFEVCRRLKADPRTAAVPVIFLSASSSGDYRRRAFRLGAADFLAKPFQTDQLPAYLHALINGTPGDRLAYSGRIVAVAGGARGSALAVELAETQALRCGCPVMLVDLELPAGSIGARLQLAGGPNVRVLLQDTGEPVTDEDLRRVAQRLHFGLEVIPAPFSPSPLGQGEPHAGRLAEVIDRLAEAGYFVVLHLGTNADDLAATAAGRAAVVYMAEETAAGEWRDALAARGAASVDVRPLGDAMGHPGERVGAAARVISGLSPRPGEPALRQLATVI